MKIRKKNVYITCVILGAVMTGALVAKIAPLDSNHGFSAFVRRIAKNNKQETSFESATTSESTQETTSNNEIQSLSYIAQINKEVEEGKFANRMKMKVLLQTDDRWKETAYGSGNTEGNTLGNNGCAILSLTMVASFLDEKEYVPQEILNWSKNDYYMEGQGTVWAIFSDFASMKTYQFKDLEMDIAAVEDHLKQGHPVIVSVKPGTFTETGHIMVLSGINDGNFWVNDPNDSEEKGHSKKEFSRADIENDAVNFWAIYK